MSCLRRTNSNGQEGVGIRTIKNARKPAGDSRLHARITALTSKPGAGWNRYRPSSSCYWISKTVNTFLPIPWSARTEGQPSPETDFLWTGARASTRARRQGRQELAGSNCIPLQTDSLKKLTFSSCAIRYGIVLTSEYPATRPPRGRLTADNRVAMSMSRSSPYRKPASLSQSSPTAPTAL